MHIYQKPKKNMLRDMLFAENFSCLYMKTHESIHRKEQTHTHTHTYIFAHMRVHTHSHTNFLYPQKPKMISSKPKVTDFFPFILISTLLFFSLQITCS